MALRRSCAYVVLLWYRALDTASSRWWDRSRILCGSGLEFFMRCESRILRGGGWNLAEQRDCLAGRSGAVDVWNLAEWCESLGGRSGVVGGWNLAEWYGFVGSGSGDGCTRGCGFRGCGSGNTTWIG